MLFCVGVKIGNLVDNESENVKRNMILIGYS